jgi:hypothetical protein
MVGSKVGSWTFRCSDEEGGKSSSSVVWEGMLSFQVAQVMTRRCALLREIYRTLSSAPKEVKRVSRHDSASCFFSLSKKKECEAFQWKTLAECDFVFAANW